MARGRRYVTDVPRWSNSHCQVVQFDPLTFYPDKHVHVQISVSHVNDTTPVHDAAVSWVENVGVNNFTFCVMESGRNEGPPHGFATVEYMAYQGAPSGSLAGLVSIPEWWTGTKCQTVDLSEVSKKFNCLYDMILWALFSQTLTHSCPSIPIHAKIKVELNNRAFSIR